MSWQQRVTRLLLSAAQQPAQPLNDWSTIRYTILETTHCHELSSWSWTWTRVTGHWRLFVCFSFFFLYIFCFWSRMLNQADHTQLFSQCWTLVSYCISLLRWRDSVPIWLCTTLHLINPTVRIQILHEVTGRPLWPGTLLLKQMFFYGLPSTADPPSYDTSTFQQMNIS